MRIASPGEAVVATSYYGDTVVVMDAASLSDVPQWYAGFSRVIVPVMRWFELPAAIREAIFRSRVRVVFFGIPDRVPTMSPTDRALLPIELRPEAGAVAVPWPYGDGRTAIPTPVSWRAKVGAHIIGSNGSPYLAANAVATFAADEKAIEGPLPAWSLTMPGEGDPAIPRWPTPAEVLREYRPAIVFIFGLSLCIASWVVFRRRPRAAMLGVTVAVALATIGWRNTIHPAAATHHFKERAMLAPGVVDILRVRTSCDLTPARVPAEEGPRGTVTYRPDMRVGGDAELRTSQTAPGFGEIDAPGRPWLATTRVSTSRELGQPATVRIRSRDASQLVLEYQSDRPINYVSAVWRWNGRPYYGDVHVASARGQATIRAARRAWQWFPSWSWLNELDERLPEARAAVTLRHIERDRTDVISMLLPAEGSEPPRSYRIYSTLRQQAGDRFTTMFILPAPVPAGAASEIAFPMFGAATVARSVTLSGPAGSVSLDVRWTGRMPFKAELRADDLQRIAPAGGIVRLDLESSETISGATAVLHVMEKPQ
jgi:hypothetical protein